jgi:hypothetical protein
MDISKLDATRTTTLDLAGIRLTNATLEQLTGPSALTTLFLSDTGIADAG